MSGSKAKGGDKSAKRSWAQRVFGWKEEAPKQNDAPINQEVFVLAHQFGDLMRGTAYAELPESEKTKLRTPVEQAIAGQKVDEIKQAIGTFKTDLEKAREAFVKSVNDRIAADEKLAKALGDRGAPGVKAVEDPLKIAKKDAAEGRVGAAAAQLDTAEAAILNAVNAQLGLAEGRINSLTDWGAPEAGALATRLKTLRSKSTLDTVEATLSGFDTLMHDVAAAATVPVQQQKTRGLDELRKGIVAALAGVPEDAPTQPTTTTPPTSPPQQPLTTPQQPPPRPSTPPQQPPPTTGGDKPTPPPRPRGLQPMMGRRTPPPPPPKPTKAELQSRFDTWDKDLTDAGKETDAKKKDTALDTLDTSGTKLYADILRAKGGDTKAEKEAVFKKALEARYGFTIDTKGRDFTNLDKMYEVLKMVPPEDVAQNKLKTLQYGKPGEEGAAYGGAMIEMGDYGDATGTWPYQNPDGTPAPANGFSISALHELGHSIDDRNGIMSSNQGKGGCGGWQPESVASVTQAFFTVFRFGPGKESKIPEETMKSLISEALVNGAPGKPGTVSDTDWGPMKTQLDQCAGLRADAWPWNNPTTIGSRAYHQSYKESNEWWSYDPGARSGTTVRAYQWRSPAEWFAELYAFTYFKKQKPPSGIDAGVAVFMWKS